MDPAVASFSKLLAVLTILAHAGIFVYLVATILSLYISAIKHLWEKLLKTVSPHARLLAFTVALCATLGSLFYSEIAKLPPCLLCWWQRVFIYPQVLLIGMGILKNDKNAADYSMAFSVMGGVVALYQYYIQLGGTAFLSCGASTVSCTQRFSLEFGYVTIPLMSLTACATLFLLMFVYKRYTK